MARFIYYNVNPEGKREEDCVVRAITLCSGYSYETIKDKLQMTGELLDCDQLCMACYKLLLENVFKYKPIRNVCGLTVEEFADMYPYGTYLVRVEGHITSCIDNDIFDIWDCRKEIVTNCWRVD